MKSLQEIFQTGPNLTSCLVCILMIILIKVIIEPEKIKPVAFLLSFFILVSSFLLILHNLYKYFFCNIRAEEFEYWDTGNSGLLIGVSIFSFESISCIINGIIDGYKLGERRKILEICSSIPE